MAHCHPRPEIERLFWLRGELDRDQVNAGADHLCVEDDVGLWMGDIGHM